MPVICPRSNNTISTHMLTVLSVAGVQRLLTGTRSPLAPHVLKWIMGQVEAICAAGASAATSSAAAAASSSSSNGMGAPTLTTTGLIMPSPEDAHIVVPNANDDDDDE